MVAGSATSVRKVRAPERPNLLDNAQCERSRGKCHRKIPPERVRVQRCGKSAPAVLRGTGSVNPGWEQGRRVKGWSFSRPALGEPLEVFGNGHPR